ncbi:hypothetical protein [uncultured Tistrella sp.]|uniref:hypothetical protein n=1 Tax=Tistrella mobilis TaxID=171437 RepID=UPI00262885F0|nr:hypothetical protein [uncultured Tistrella sp.]
MSDPHPARPASRRGRPAAIAITIAAAALLLGACVPHERRSWGYGDPPPRVYHAPRYGYAPPPRVIYVPRPPVRVVTPPPHHGPRPGEYHHRPRDRDRRDHDGHHRRGDGRRDDDRHRDRDGWGRGRS